MAVLACGVALVAGWLAYTRLGQTPFHWAEFLATFERLNWAWMACAIACVLLSYVGRALRWQVMLSPLCADSRLWDLISATIIGFAAIVVLGRPGEVVRPYLIAKKAKVTLSSQMAAWLLERIFDLLALMLIFGFALARMPASNPTLSPALQWVLRVGGYFVAGICLACLSLLFFFQRFAATPEELSERLPDRIPAKIRGRIGELASAFATGLKSSRGANTMWRLIAYTALEWFLIAAVYAAVFRAFPATANLRIGQIFVFLGLVAFGSIIQIPGVGGGVQVMAVLVLTEMFKIHLETATGIAIIIWLLTFVVAIPPAILLAIAEGLSWRQIRQAEEEAAV